MNSREHLAEDIKRIDKVVRSVGGGVWGVAVFVMIIGVVVSFGTLADHGIPRGVAWMPSLAADVAMSVAIIAGPILARYDVPSGWIGVLRWFAALATWALQTAGPWLHDNGPDWAGVGLHSIAPALLFVVGEGAAYFVRKMSSVRSVKQRELAAAEQKDADRRAHLAETEANLRAALAEASALTSEKDSHLREIDRLTAEVTSSAAVSTSEVTTLRASVTALEGEKVVIRDTYEARLQATQDKAAEDLRKADEARVEEVQRLKRELRQARAEASLPHLEDKRRERNGGPSTAPAAGPSGKGGTRARFTDEEAVQRLLEAPSDAAKNLPSGRLREWSQQAIVDTLSVGWQRAPRLLEAVTEAQRQLRSETPSGDRAANQ